MKQKLHPAWIVAAITFFTLFATAAEITSRRQPRSSSSGRIKTDGADLNPAVAINVLLYGLTAPFAAALMERFTVRKVVMAALFTVGTGALGTIWIHRAKDWINRN